MIDAWFPCRRHEGINYRKKIAVNEDHELDIRERLRRFVDPSGAGQ